MTEFSEDVIDVEFSFLCPKCGMKVCTSISRMRKAVLSCPGCCGTVYSLGNDDLHGTYVEAYSVHLPEILKVLDRKKRGAKT